MAGSFADCWRAVWSGGSKVVYCRGVGAVQVEFGTELNRELLDYEIVGG
jgi:hypothetical protein